MTLLGVEVLVLYPQSVVQFLCLNAQSCENKTVEICDFINDGDYDQAFLNMVINMMYEDIFCVLWHVWYWSRPG